jgi:thiol-disulfide isomerase/thioredoxin
MPGRLVPRIALILLVFGACRATQPTHAADVTRRQAFQKIQEEYGRKLAAFNNASEGIRNNADAAKVAKLKPSAAEYCKRFLALAKEKPDDDVALDALAWIVENDDSEDPFTQLEDVINLIEKHHLASPRLKSVIPSLASSASLLADALLEELIEKGGDRGVRGSACFFLANSRYERLEGKILAEVEILLERVKKEYADIRIDDEDKPLGAMADALLFEVKYLQPGKVAPDIEGTDVNGKRMKLSDQRGKVVMLVFWGSWCGPCMAEVPHERKLMAAYSGRPFTVVGINSGDSKDKAAKTIKDNKMTWPSFHDGPDGPIVARWNISSFPTVYLLDAKGVILVTDLLDEEDADKTIEEAVKDAEM